MHCFAVFGPVCAKAKVMLNTQGNDLSMPKADMLLEVNEVPINLSKLQVVTTLDSCVVSLPCPSHAPSPLP